MFDRLAIAWAIYRSGTPENLRELTEYGNAGPIADAVIAALNDAIHKSGVSNRPLNADAVAAPAPSCAPGEVGLASALAASLAKRSVPTMDPLWSAAFNAALDMVARDTAAALSPQGLDAKEGRSPDYDPMKHGMTAKTEVDRLAILLFEAFAKAEPREGITLYPASYWATFADMARAIIADRAAPSQRLDAATVEREGEWRPIEVEALRKGFRRSPKYYPAIGETCRMSGPNCDDDQGYTWIDVEVLWRDDLFVVTRKPGCWPTVTKLELALFEPALATEPHQHGGKGA